MRLARIAVLALALGTVVAAPVRPALAGTPCWKTLLNDWYDGRIDKTYAVPCYRDALAHLPSDLSVYSSARDDIQRELQSAIVREHNPTHPSTTTAQPHANGRAGSPATSTSTRPAKTGTSTRSEARPPVAHGPGRRPRGEFAKAASRFNPGSADSLPVPLLVLAGLALLLLAAGAAGALVRRSQARRL